ncbi:alpha/beta fold hydrolase [Mycobacterium sp. E2462]|uniref:alpha/beta fold hydrolase n=1 Tax=Mycobacterium sp. E2462 TaxID=1834133 RepID=UPI000A5880E1|nr:alpha/beta fold hydrolase [Mycobacterium sp. E2462]
MRNEVAGTGGGAVSADEVARRMEFVRRGAGTPLLLIHGLGSSWPTWDLVAPTLAARREVIAVDLPGFGSSAPLPGEVSIASLTDAVETFIAHHGLGEVDVVGSSMGARMVLEMARRGHAGTVVALDPGGFWTDRQVRVFGATVGASIALVRRIQPVVPALTRTAAGRTALLVQFSAKPWRLPPRLVLEELRSFGRASSLDAALRALVHGPKQLGAAAGSLNGKVVIGWGRNDRVTTPSQAMRAWEAFPDARLHWFDECGHFPHWDQPEAAARLILASV